MYIGANNLYDWAMSQPLLSCEIEYNKNVELEDLLNTPEDSDSGYFVECDLLYSYSIKE